MGRPRPCMRAQLHKAQSKLLGELFLNIINPIHKGRDIGINHCHGALMSLKGCVKSLYGR